MKIFIFFLLALDLSYSAEKSLDDVVHVAGTKPFFIQVFEVSNKLAADENIVNLWPAQSWKPARFDYSEAVRYCRTIGGRLPTKDEWLQAATNLGKNLDYTLKEDRLFDDNQNLLAHIKGSASKSVYDFDSLGIDAIGTVGMTGNRPEFVESVNNSNPVLCGGAYETKNEQRVHLSQICRNLGQADTENATARCVFDLDENTEYQLNYSEKVKGELQEYIAILAESLYLYPIDAYDTNPTTSAFIPENKWSKKEDGDPELLQYLDPDEWLDGP